MLGDTIHPANLWSDSIDQPVIPEHPQTMRAPKRPCSIVQMPRGCLSSGRPTVAQRRNVAVSLPLSTPSSSLASMDSCEQALGIQTNIVVSIKSEIASSDLPVESEKTRRARYAANQQHSKAKQARKDSQQDESIDTSGIRSAHEKQRHREKNKVAAAKCRSRQRKQMKTIQDKGAELGEKNTQLKSMVQELRAELNVLRSMALDHQQCNCSVTRYNHKQVERLVAEYRSSCLGHTLRALVHL